MTTQPKKKSNGDRPSNGTKRPTESGRAVSWRDLAEAAGRAREAAEKRLGR